MNFNPRPPCGGRPTYHAYTMDYPEFQSTPPVWGATETMKAEDRARYISIHAPRVGGDVIVVAAVHAASSISIHAPRVGGDTLYSRTRTRIEISIHAPRVGGDPQV